MANGKETDHFVVTAKVKKGLKREFEFAVKSQSEILGSTRRTRGRYANEGGVGIAMMSEGLEKRLKVVERELEVEVEREGMDVEENEVGDLGSEDSLKSGIEDPGSNDEKKSEGFSSQDVILETPVVGGDSDKDNAETGNQVEAKPLRHYSRMKFKRKVADATKGGLVNDKFFNSESGSEVEKDVKKDDENSNSEFKPEVRKDDEISNSESGPEVEKDIKKDDENSNSAFKPEVRKDDESSNSESGPEVEKDVRKDDENSNSEFKPEVRKDDESSNSESGPEVEKDVKKDDENSNSEFKPELRKDDESSNSESGPEVEKDVKKDDENSNSAFKPEVEKDDENSNSAFKPEVMKDDESSNSESGPEVEKDVKKDDENSNSEFKPEVRKDDESSNSESEPEVEKDVKKDDENSNSEFKPELRKDDESSNSESGPEVEQDDGLIKVKLSKPPKLLKEFFEAGLFEGLHVQYFRSVKAKASEDDANIRGMIKGNGILCFCNKCRGKEIVTPHVFERHAFSSNKRPPEYIFLENGKSLRDVMNACKDVPVDAIVETIQKATGPAPQPREEVIGSIRDSHTSVNLVTSSPRYAATNSADRYTGKPVSVEPLPMVASKGSSNKIGGKITQKNLGLHKLVFEEDVLPDGTEVTYVANKQVLLTGYKSGLGICCECCNKVISPSQFEAHAGRASHRKPFHNIYTSNGVSLHELAVMLNKSFNKERDDVCNDCRKGGDIIPCGGCPRSFHKECARSLRKLDGTWYCRHCESNMKENHINANALAAGRVPGVDSIEQIVNRSIRIVNTGEVEIGGCILCRDPAFTKEFGPLTVIICEQCEREYHVGCLKEKGMADLTKEPDGDWFCCQDCERIHSSLHKLVARGEERLPDFLLGAIKNKTRPSVDSASESKLVVKWRILSGKMASEECRPLLLAAAKILQENFGHIIDPSTNADLIPAMVNGEELKIQDFRGMYCAVLTVNSTVVSAGVFRIRGQELAEMPLVATSSQAHGQGYFQSLYACIERFLGFVKVRKIMLPAANGAEEIWTKKFGFSQMTEEGLKPFMETYHLMNFQGLPWFEKTVPRIRIIS